MSNEVFIVAGTRPEGIKMAPIYYALQEKRIPTLLCSTFQHTTLLHDVFNTFALKPDIALNIMQPGQPLHYLTETVLHAITQELQRHQPRLVLVQGDTTSCMAAALAAFYLKIPVGHVEAGLRTSSIHNPFPEEFNRRTVALIAQLHFAPTKQAYSNLIKENIDPNTIYLTGNTVIDALHMVQNKIRKQEIAIDESLKNIIADAQQAHKKIVVFTMHRRESFGAPMVTILKTLNKFVEKNPHCIVIYPFHPNPCVLEALEMSRIRHNPSIFLMNPLSYASLIYALHHADVVVTDSGGIQEEAVHLLKPVLIIRTETERTEGIDIGLAQLVGFDPHAVESSLAETLRSSHDIASCTVYGTGTAGLAIATIIENTFYQHLNNRMNLYKENV